MQKNEASGNNIAQNSLAELRNRWAEYWSIQPHKLIGRTMLEVSLQFAIWERETGGLSSAQRARLDNLITAYKRNSKIFEADIDGIKPGTRLVRMHKGQRHSVLVHADGYEYKDKKYSSLSEVAFDITGTRWNGWVFFGLKRRSKK